MGGSSFSAKDWGASSETLRGKTLNETNTATSLPDDINPALMKGGKRESCDSDANPNSTAIIVSLDMTGSMRGILSHIMQYGLGDLFKEIYSRKPVSDPQVLFCGVGDAMVRDPAPFQVGQFESECGRLIDGLTKFWPDGCGGGGNDMESYDLPYYFAGHMTKTDCMIKRNQKGFIFTIGDEPPPIVLTKEIIKKVFNHDVEKDMPFKDVLRIASQSYIPFHIIMKEGSHPRNYGMQCVLEPWQELLGENVIICDDHKKLSEVIVSILEVKAGKSKTEIVDSWDSSTAVVVRNAIKNLPANTDAGVVF